MFLALGLKAAGVGATGLSWEQAERRMVATTETAMRRSMTRLWEGTGLTGNARETFERGVTDRCFANVESAIRIVKNSDGVKEEGPDSEWTPVL
jgi:hypothetical protein